LVTAEAQVGEQTFEQRHFERLRLAGTAQEIGRTAVSGYERRRYDEVTSGLTEALSGTVETEYSFELKDGRFVAEDGEPIEELLLRALNKDIKLASRDSFYSFLPQRSRAELDNFRRMQAMARGESACNALVEISPYTQELDTSQGNREKLEKAAQMPAWGRTMVRLSHWDGQQLHILTLSSDNQPAAETFTRGASIPSVQLFKEAARRSLGYSFEAETSGGMLAEVIPLRVNDGSWKQAAKDLVSEADRILAERHGGQWKQGRPEHETVDLQKYVESQTQVLEGLFAAERRLAAQYSDYESYEKAFHNELRKSAALLERRLELGKQDEAIVDYETAAAGAGAWADAAGRTYNMCGLVLTPEQSEAQAQSPFESLMRLMNKKIHCPECSKEVVVPEGDLKEGKLSCAECGYWVDVCTGGKGYAKKTAEGIKSKAVSGFEIIAGWFKKEAEDRRIRKLAEKQARGELGENVRYLDIKRHEKRLQRQAQA
jgi:hypothetical protein